MACCSCWPWCRTPPQTRNEKPPETLYIESKSVVRPTSVDIPSPRSPKHGRALSTMFIKDGKVIVSHRGLSQEESNKDFTVTTLKSSSLNPISHTHTPE